LLRATTGRVTRRGRWRAPFIEVILLRLKAKASRAASAEADVRGA
jgi:hypothetical protein